MNLIDRYLGGVVLRSSLGALAVLVALAGFFAFLTELAELEGRYGVAQAAWVVTLTLPQWAYEFFPTAILIGTLYGLGSLAAGSELVVLRAAGVSPLRLARAALQTVLLLALMIAGLGETLAPAANRAASVHKAAAQGEVALLRSGRGFWAKDGDNFLQAQGVLPGAVLQDVTLYRYGSDRQLQAIARARSVKPRGGGWVAEQVVETRFERDRVQTRQADRERWDLLLKPALLSVLSVDPDELPAHELQRYIEYLEVNELDNRRYRAALWYKLLLPASALVMVLVAFPALFGPLRSANAGTRLLAGVLLGLALHLVNQVSQQAGLVYGVAPLVAAALPLALFAAAAVIALRRVT